MCWNEAPAILHGISDEKVSDSWRNELLDRAEEGRSFKEGGV